MKAGKVSLVGAGPGDPGLITLNGLRRLESADVVVYDRLVDRRLLGHARAGAELIDAGKEPGEGAGRQSEINGLLVDRARKGKRVVRLKGGDPFVFGRGGEEAEALRLEGVRFEVVPGVTSAIAAPAYAGIPVTHRGHASSFTVVTGSEAPDKDSPSVEWEALARQGGTLVVLMGWENLRSIVETLVRNGRPPDTPVALVRWGTESHQQTVVGTLADICDMAELARLSPPVVAVVGETVALRDGLRWFDNRPLFGKRVLVTRTRAQAGVLSALLSERGAEAIELPAIEVQPPEDFAQLDKALGRLKGYGWVVFTSVNGVDAVFDRFDALGRDTRAFATSKVAAIGAATAARLKDHGIVADFVPESFLSEAVVDGLRHRRLEGELVLLPRADIATATISDGLRAMGATVEEVVAYRTVTPKESGPLVDQVLSDGIDIATFTSSSTVRNLARLLGGSLDRLAGATIACIGPITATTARESGLEVDIVANEHTVAGLVDALEEHFAEEGPPHE